MTEFEKEYNVHVYETGANGRLTLTGFFNFLQDTASEHAERLNFGRNDLLKNNHIWVLSRMYAEIDQLPVWNDKVIVRTWPSAIDKILALRDFQVLNKKREQIAAATSSWAIIDQTSKRVQRPDDIIANFHDSLNLSRSLSRNAAKLENVSTDGYLTPIYKVKFSDLDVNLHVNNVKFLQWATDSYPLDFILENTPKTVEINYLSESVCGDEIKILISQDKSNLSLWNHSILRINDNRELCRIRIKWETCYTNKVY